MPSCVTHINTNLQKYKNSCDSSKDRLDTKILNQFSKLPDKKPFVGPFLSPKNLNLTLLFFKSVHASAVGLYVRWTCEGYTYVSPEINCFTKSYRLVNIKNACFSKLETRFSRLETGFVRVHKASRLK